MEETTFRPQFLDIELFDEKSLLSGEKNSTVTTTTGKHGKIAFGGKKKANYLEPNLTFGLSQVLGGMGGGSAAALAMDTRYKGEKPRGKRRREKRAVKVVHWYRNKYVPTKSNWHL